MVYPSSRSLDHNPSVNGRNHLASRTKELQALARKLRCDPLEVFILEINDLLREAEDAMRDQNVPIEIRKANRRALRSQAVEVAAKLAPYLHPRLASIELSGNEQNPVNVSIDEGRDKFISQLLGLAAAIAAGKSGGDDAVVIEGQHNGSRSDLGLADVGKT